MAEEDIPRRNLYDNLVDEGYDLGTYSDFTAAIDKEGTRKILYDNLVDEGYDIGDYDSFNEQLNIGNRYMSIGGKRVKVSEDEYQDFMRRHPSGRNNEKSQTKGEVAKAMEDKPAVIAKNADGSVAYKGDKVPEDVGAEIAHDAISGATVNGKQAEQQPRAKASAEQIAQMQSMMEYANGKHGVRVGHGFGQFSDFRSPRQKANTESMFGAKKDVSLSPDESGFSMYEDENGELQVQYEGRKGDAYRVNKEQREYAESMQSLEDRFATTNTSIEKQIAEESQAMNDLRAGQTTYYNLGGNMVRRQSAMSPEFKDHERNYNMLTTAQRKMQETQRVLDAAQRYKDDPNAFTRFFRDYWTSALSTATDLSTWDFGMTDLNDAVNIRNLYDKADRGEKLTSAEQSLLDAVTLNSAMQLKYEDEQGVGNMVGQTVVEMVPFMVEMALNPASGFGSAAGKSMAQKMARYAAKRFMRGQITKQAGKWMVRGAKWGTRAMADIGAGAVMANTSGAMRTGADVLDRMNNNDDMSIGRAVFEGEANAIIQNQSEFVGEYFEPLMKVVGKGVVRGMERGAMRSGSASLQKMLSSSLDVMNRIGNTKAYKTMQEFNDKAHYNGPLGEYIEEFIGNVELATLGVDQEFSTGKNGIFNPEDNWATFLAVAVPGVTQSVVATTQHAATKGVLSKRLGDADKRGDEKFGYYWHHLRSGADKALAGCTDDFSAAGAELAKIEKYFNLKGDELKAFRDYVKAKSMSLAYDIAATEKEEDDEDEFADAIEALKEKGHEIETHEEAHEAGAVLDAAEVSLNELDGNIKAQIDRMREDGVSDGEMLSFLNDLSEDERQAAEDYLHAQAVVDGIEEKVSDDVQKEVDNLKAEIEPYIDPESGNFITAMLDDEMVYVKGIVGDTVYYFDDEGNVKSTDISNVTNIEVNFAESYIENFGNTLYDKASADAETKINNHPNTNTILDTGDNSEFTLVDADNKVTKYKVVENNGESITYVELMYSDEVEGYVPKKDTMPFVSSIERVIEDQNLSWDAFDNRRDAESEVSTEETVDADGETVEGEAVEETPAEEEAEAIVEDSESADAERPYPVDADGEFDYNNATEDEAQAYFDEVRSEDGDEVADTLLNNLINEIDKQIDKLAGKEPKLNGLKRNAWKAEHKKWEDDMNALNERAQRYKAVRDVRAEESPTEETADVATVETMDAPVIEESAEEATMGTPEPVAPVAPVAPTETQKRVNPNSLDERIKKLGDPQSLWESIALNAFGYKYVWGNDKNGTRGLGSHLFGNPSEAERRRRLSILASRAKGGLYPEEVAERMMESLSMAWGENIDEKDVFDTILDVLSRYENRGQLVSAIEEMREKQAEDEANAQIDAMNREAQSLGFMDYDEMVAYEEVAMESIVPMSDEQYDEYINQIIEENDRRIENETPKDAGVSEGVEQGAESGSTEAGSQMGVGQQEDTNVGGAEVSAESGNAEAGSESGDAVVAEREGERIEGISREDIDNAIGGETDPEKARGKLMRNFAIGYIKAGRILDAIGLNAKTEDKNETPAILSGEIFKNNMAGGDAVVRVLDVGKGQVLVEYTTELDLINEGQFLGDRAMSVSEFNELVKNGSFTPTGKMAELGGKVHDIEDNAETLTDEDISSMIEAMKRIAVNAPSVELTEENWKNIFDTPIGKVKMGENQMSKLFDKGREQQYGMLNETLSNPDIILEEADKEVNTDHERPSTYLFVKTFAKEDGIKYVHFESVTVSKDGMEVSISSHIIRENQLKAKLKRDKLLYKATALDAPAKTSAEQLTIGGSLSSDSKGNDNKSNEQENKAQNTKETAKKTKKAESERKIDDWGEKLLGARKDMLKELAKTLDNVTAKSLAQNPLSKVFKKPDFGKLVASGALREKDARVCEAIVNALIPMSKPKAGTREDRVYAYNHNGKSQVQAWAEEAAKGVETLNRYMKATEEERDAMLEELTAEEYPFKEEEEAEYKKREELNPGMYFARTYTPNPITFALNLLDDIGYKAGDKLSPLPRARKAKYSNGLEVVDEKGKRKYYGYEDDVRAFAALYVKATDCLDGLEIPERSIHVRATRRKKSETPTGWSVTYFTSKGNIQEQTFRDEQEAKEYEEKIRNNGYLQVKNTPVYGYVGDAYSFVFTDPKTAELIELEDGKYSFASADEARAYLQEHYDEVNAALVEANSKAKNKEIKKREPLVVSMVHTKNRWGYSICYVDPIVKSMSKGLNDYVPIKDFETKKEAEEYLKEHKEELLAPFQKIKDEVRNFVYFTPENERKGEDYRNDRDVTEEEFGKEFGFRGVQFGNWANQQDRQEAINQAYDAFKDMARALGLSDKAMSLNGELGIAFGSRGKGSANAHYEPAEVVINLTKTRGAGSLAHEWLHALDNYFSRANGDTYGMVTAQSTTDGMRPELRRAFTELMDAVRKTDYHDRSVKRGTYWGSSWEVAARLFAEYIKDKLNAEGKHNSFLSRGIEEDRYEGYMHLTYMLYRHEAENPMSFEEWKKTPQALGDFPYPTKEETKALAPLIENVFSTIKEEVKSDGTVRLYQIGDNLEGLTNEQKETANTFMQMVKDAGVPVNMTSQEELAQIGGELQASKKKENFKFGDKTETEWLSAIQAIAQADNAHKNTNLSTESQTVSATKVGIVKRIANELDVIIAEIEKKALTQEELRQKLAVALIATDGVDSKYNNDLTLADNREVSIRIADHYAHTKNHITFNHNKADGNYGFVIHHAENDRFRSDARVNYAEFVYFGDKIEGEQERQIALIEGIKHLVETGSVAKMPKVDSLNVSGKYKAAMNPKVQRLTTPSGVIYGVAYNGVIYLNKDIIKADTPLHEYTHLWDNMLQTANPKMWEAGKELLKQTSVWQDVMNDPNYADIWDDENKVASEVHSRLTGEKGARMLEDEVKKGKDASFVEKVKQWIKDVFTWVRNTLSSNTEGLTLDEFLAMPIRDLAEGVDPTTIGQRDDVQMQVGSNGVLNAVHDIYTNPIFVKARRAIMSAINEFANVKSKKSKFGGEPETEIVTWGYDAILESLGEGLGKVYSQEKAKALYDTLKDKLEDYIFVLDEKIRNKERWKQGKREIDVYRNERDQIQYALDYYRNAANGVNVIAEGWDTPKFRNGEEGVRSAGNKMQMSDAVADVARRLNSDAEVVSSDAEIDAIEGLTEAEKRDFKQRGKAVFVPMTGKIYVNLNNNMDEADAVKSVIHEAVGHKGLRQMFGKMFTEKMREVYGLLPQEAKKEIAQSAIEDYGFDIVTATEEWLAREAESNEDPTLWNIVKSALRDMLRKLGFDIMLNRNDVRYLLWQSKNQLTGDPMMRAMSMMMRKKLGINEVGEGGFPPTPPSGSRISRRVKEWKKKYGGADVVLVADDVTKDELMNAGFTEEDAEKAIELNSQDSFAGAYFSNSEKILIFESADKYDDTEFDAIMFHENIHAALDNVRQWTKEGLFRDFLSVYNNKKLTNFVEKMYKDFQYMEEVFVYAMEDAIVNGKVDELVNMLPENDRDIINNILKDLNYGEEERVQRSRQAGKNGYVRIWESATAGERNEREERKRGERKGGEAEGVPEVIYFGRAVLGATDSGINIIAEDNGSARAMYERTLNQTAYHMQEIFQDSMLGLKTLMTTIMRSKGKRFEDVSDWENAYWAENRMSSTNEQEFIAYRKMYYAPLLKAVKGLMQLGNTYSDIVTYMMAKHGLERNKVMAMRDAQRVAKEEIDYENRKSQLEKDLADGTITPADYSVSISNLEAELATAVQPHYEDNRKRDYAGLTQLTGHEKDDEIAEIEADAQRFVDDFESASVDQMDAIDELWEKVNAATKAQLEKQYQSGMMNEVTYLATKDMYQYYIPLRGFEDVTSDEVYDYLQVSVSPMSEPLKKAEGRTSQADDPIATIGNMAESGIMVANRNLMKQKFLLFVENNPSDLCTINEYWAHENSDGSYTTILPDIPADATESEAEDIRKQFEEDMIRLSEDDDTYKKKRGIADIPYRTLKRFENEHQVVVKRGGKTYIISVNGNPRAAQAINGLTNPDADSEMMKWLGGLTNWMARCNTTWSVPFIFSNLCRDAFYANSMVLAKESWKYSKLFSKNWAKVLVKIVGLVHRYNNGTLDMSKEMDRYFSEFILAGGETGVTRLTNVEGYKDIIKDELKKMGRGKWHFKNLLDFLGNSIELLNRSAEDTSRFAAYMTSRQSGRSVSRSIWDAKEVSVNFNKKGAAGKTKGAWEEGNKLTYSLGMTAQFIRPMYMFFNAGVQGMFNIGRIAKNHRGKFASVAASYFGLGIIMPVINAILSQGGGDGDDNDNYWNLPEYIRRNNLCIYAGNGYITLPLPIELRAIYGLGDIFVSKAFGANRKSADELVLDIACQFSQIFPIDFLEGSDNAKTVGELFGSLVPSPAKPWYELVINRDYTGRPIYKEHNDNNIAEPEFQMVYSRTDKTLINASKALNDFLGGNDHRKAKVFDKDADVNPAKVQHIIQSYLGAMGKMVIFDMARTAETMFTDDFEWTRVPVVNRFFQRADDRTKGKALKNEFYKYNEKAKELESEFRGWERALQTAELKNDSIGKADALYHLQRMEANRDAEKFDRWNEMKREYNEMMYKSGEYEDKEESIEGIMNDMIDIFKDDKKE